MVTVYEQEGNVDDKEETFINSLDLCMARLKEEAQHEPDISDDVWLREVIGVGNLHCLLK